MSREELIDAIGELPEDLLAPVAALRQKKSVHWGRWVALAACICLVLLPLSWQGWQAGSKAAGEADRVPNEEMSLESVQGNGAPQYGIITDSTGRPSFRAEVLEVDGNCILVRPLEGEAELNSADKIYVSFGKLQDVPRIEVGDTVEIFYDGTLMESYPAQTSGVTGIRVIE